MNRNAGQLSLEEIVDRCVDDLIAERATLDECLARYPEQREALEPILRMALALEDVPVEDVRPDPARRAAFMAELSETPQHRARFRLPLLPLPAFGIPAMWRGALIGVPAAIVALVAVLFVTATSPTTASAATLTVFAGSVERQAGTAWVPLDDGATLTEGTTLRTGPGSRALMTFADGSTATVDASTQVTLDRIEFGTVSGSGRHIEIDQASGRIWNDVVPVGEGESYVIRTPHAVVSAHGTVFETRVDSITAVRADSGLVRVAAHGQLVEVRPGQRANATTERVEAAVEATVTAHIAVDAPAVAYLSSADGSATGAVRAGAVFQQVPGISVGAAETNGQSQRFTLGDVSPGRYSLVVERIADGEGNIVIDTPAGRIVLPVPAGEAFSRVEVDVEERDGVKTLRPVESVVRALPRDDAPGVRVSEAARSRPGIDLAALVAARAPSSATPGPTAPEAVPHSPTATPTTPGPTAEPDRGRPEDTPGARPSAATAERPGRPVTPTERPTEQAPVPTPVTEWNEAFREALQGDDDEALFTRLQQVLTGDAGMDSARLAAIMRAVDDPEVRDRIATLLATEPHRGTGEVLGDALDRIRPGAGDFIRERVPAIPGPALPIRPPGLQRNPGNNDRGGEAPGRGIPLPLPGQRATPEASPTPTR